MDISRIENAELSLNLQTDRFVSGLAECKMQLQQVQFDIINVTALANRTRQDADQLLAAVDTLTDLVNYLLSIQASSRLANLEQAAAWAAANITALHAMDVVTNSRTSVLEGRADDHERRVQVLERDNADTQRNVSILQNRATTTEFNVSVLKSREDFTEAKLEGVRVNLTENINATGILIQRADNFLFRISTMENYTVPRCGMLLLLLLLLLCRRLNNAAPLICVQFELDAERHFTDAAACPVHITHRSYQRACGCKCGLRGCYWVHGYVRQDLGRAGWHLAGNTDHGRWDSRRGPLCGCELSGVH